MRGRRRYESNLAARALGSILSFERCLALLLDQCRRQPGSPAAEDMLRSIVRFRYPSEIQPLGYSSETGIYPATVPVNRMLLLDVVLESHGSPLQKDFLDHVGRSWSEDNQPMLLTILTESDLAAFYDMLQSSSGIFSEYSQQLKGESKTLAVDTALGRLAGLIRAPDGKLNLEAVSAFTSFYGRIEMTTAQAGKIFDAIVPHLEACFRPDAPEAETAAAGKLVERVVRKVCIPGPIDEKRPRCTNWKDVPPAMRDACRRFLGYVNHKVHGKQALALLGSCHYRLLGAPPGEVEPEMLEAMEKARAAIMEKGTAADQATLLAYMAAAGDEALQAQADAELQRRLLAGQVPPEQCASAFRALSRRAQLLTPEFVQFMFERIDDTKEDADVRRSMIGVLCGRPEVYDRLFAVIDKLLDTDSDGYYFPGPAWRLTSQLQKLSKEKLPPPPWAKGAAGLAMKAARSVAAAYAGDSSGQYAVKVIEFYVLAAGAEAGPGLEALARDEKADPYVRAAAAEHAVDANPDTKLLTTLAGNYAKLPAEMRERLGRYAAGARNTPGAEAFFLRSLADPEVGQRSYLLSCLRLPPTPSLIAGLKELAADPLIGWHVKQVIERLENPKK